MAATADRHLLFGLLALQVGLIDQGDLVAAFQAWSRDRARGLADHLIARRSLDDDQRGLIDALVGQHLRRHGGDAERSLASLNLGGSTREAIRRVGDREVEGLLSRVGTGSTEHADADERTETYGHGPATSDGQRFRVLRPHARGGLGAVFVAFDGELNREVALKQILDQHADNPTSRQRFLLEAEITGGLEHPGIVPVYGLGSDVDGRPYYAMRFIRGDSLKEAVSRFHADEGPGRDPGRRSLGLSKLLRRFLDVCNAIDYAHTRGVLHRDIKPSNIIVGRHGETLMVDWGLAKAKGRGDRGATGGERTLVPRSASGSAETLPGSALGTPAYMSPEQARGELEAIGPRSDVYSLGATLYFLMTGRAPFEGDDVGAVLVAVQSGDFPRPRTLAPASDPALEAVCLKAMASRLEDRYPTARALAEDVERWLADESVSAWREPWGRSLVRWLTRHRAGVMAAGAATLMAMIGLGAVLIVQARANGRLKDANADLANANTRVIRANADLQAANRQVKDRYELAVEAIRTFHTGVSEDFLLKEEKFKHLRDRLLNSASEFYGRLGAMLGRGSDFESRRALAQADFDVAQLTAMVGRKEAALETHRRVLADREALARGRSPADDVWADVGLSLLEVGRILAESSRADEGLAAFDRARLILEKLGDHHPAVDRYRDSLARAHYYTGDLHYTVGRFAEAVESHRRAKDIWATLAIANPAVARFRNDQARSDLYTGQNLWLIGRTAEARECCERAVAVLRTLVDEDPEVAQARLDLAQAYNSLGCLLSLEDRPTEALATCDRGIAILRKLADENPAVTRFQGELGALYSNDGVMLAEAGRVAEAAAAQARSVAIFQKLVDENPAVTHHQSNLANCLNESGDVLRLVHRPAEAQAAYEKAVPILETLTEANPTNAQLQGWMVQGLKGLGATRRAAGRVAEAVATWRRATSIGDRLQTDYGETLYYLACCHALLGGASGATNSGLSAEDGAVELGRSMELLRRAVDAGYRGGARMRRDPDLDPLRPRPEFHLLMMDLAFPNPPFARDHRPE